MAQSATIRHFDVQRFSLVSTEPFDAVVDRILAAIGHPDPTTLASGIRDAKSFAELESFIQSLVGPSDLLEMGRFDIGLFSRRQPVRPLRGAGAS
jgi:hypothetical protein